MNRRQIHFRKFILLLCLGIFSTLSAQDQDEPRFLDNVRFGGGLGFSFGSDFFSGTLAPSAIYQFNNQFSLGVGLNGTYSSLKNEYTSTVLGGSILSLYNVIPEIQISAEFEQLNVSRNYDDRLGFENDNYWYPALFMGAGYTSNNVTLGIRYDVLYDDQRSIYANAWAPFVRVFF